MTLTQAKRLVARQAGKVSLKSLKKVFLSRRVNPRLAESVLLNNANENVLIKVRDFLVKRVIIASDKSALNVLVRASDEGLNKNWESRLHAVKGLETLAKKGELKVLPGLLKAVNDSDAIVRLCAVDGLRILALKGEAGVLPGLLVAVKDSDANVMWHAVSGLKSLAELGNKQAQKKLILLGKTW